MVPHELEEGQDVGSEEVLDGLEPVLLRRCGDQGSAVEVEELDVELLLRREVLVDQRRRDAGRGGDPLHRGAHVAALREGPARGLDDHRPPLAGAQAPMRLRLACVHAHDQSSVDF